ncbi:MAG: amino acid ABC transporter permease [Chloroflexi bacterium]|nr:amino acid ABC transporter permease [Chloroflexota bacterium]
MPVAPVTDPQTNVLPPAREGNTALRWIKENLFSSLFDSVLTIISLLFLFFALRLALDWVFNLAQWDVITENINILMKGAYPSDQVWRIWLGLYLLGAIVGINLRAWNRELNRTTIAIAAIPLILALLPFASENARINLIIIQVTSAAAYLLTSILGDKRRRQLAAVMSILYIPVFILLLEGFTDEDGIMPLVKSDLWGGLLLSVLLATVGIIFSLPLGIVLALGRRSRQPAISALCITYIEVVRGVPLISILFMGNIMLQLFMPQSLPPIDRVVRVMMAITLFTAAYMAEIVRGGLQAIPKGQYDAAYALGFSGLKSMRVIILPQALRIVIPVIVSQFIGLLLDTTLVALVGLFDLLGIGQAILSNPNWLGRSQEVYVFIGLIYWILATSMAFASQRLEKNLGVGRNYDESQ